MFDNNNSFSGSVPAASGAASPSTFDFDDLVEYLSSPTTAFDGSPTSSSQASNLWAKRISESSGQSPLGLSNSFSDTSGHEEDVLSPPSTSLYSLKVFLGGLPRGTSEVDVRRNLCKYAVSHLEMKVNAGFCFVIFQNQTAVQAFLAAANIFKDNRQYFNFYLDVFNKADEVEVRPYKLTDAHYVKNPLVAPDTCSVFVGGLPRDTAAETLAMMLEAKFGGVAEVNIDVDVATMYPRGTAIAVFYDNVAASRAIAAQTIVMKTGPKRHQSRLVELKPFLNIDQNCIQCGRIAPAVFCNHPTCMRITCEECWNAQHLPNRSNHKKITRETFYTTHRHA